LVARLQVLDLFEDSGEHQGLEHKHDSSAVIVLFLPQ